MMDETLGLAALGAVVLGAAAKAIPWAMGYLDRRAAAREARADREAQSDREAARVRSVEALIARGVTPAEATAIVAGLSEAGERTSPQPAPPAAPRSGS